MTRQTAMATTIQMINWESFPLSIFFSLILYFYFCLIHLILIYNIFAIYFTVFMYYYYFIDLVTDNRTVANRMFCSNDNNCSIISTYDRFLWFISNTATPWDAHVFHVNWFLIVLLSPCCANFHINYYPHWLLICWGLRGKKKRWKYGRATYQTLIFITSWMEKNCCF